MKIPIVREGMMSLTFDEDDVRETCRMLRCTKRSDDCVALMANHRMQCVPCYAALRVLNRPFGIRISRHMAEQRNDGVPTRGAQRRLKWRTRPINRGGVSRRALSFLLVVLLFFAVTAEAKVYFDVYGQPYKKFTIAVPPFASEEKPRPEIGDLLAQDLDLSGFFEVAPHSLMDSSLMSEGIDREGIRFDRWLSLGVDFLCKAVVQEGGNDFSLEAYLYDTSDGTLVFAKRYRAAPSEWRRVVHRLADDIILAVTGQTGIMSSRVLFVSGRSTGTST